MGDTCPCVRIAQLIVVMQVCRLGRALEAMWHAWVLDTKLRRNPIRCYSTLMPRDCNCCRSYLGVGFRILYVRVVGARACSPALGATRRTPPPCGLGAGRCSCTVAGTRCGWRSLDKMTCCSGVISTIGGACSIRSSWQPRNSRMSMDPPNTFRARRCGAGRRVSSSEMPCHCLASILIHMLLSVHLASLRSLLAARTQAYEQYVPDRVKTFLRSL